jgi:hypothetical protein
LKDLEPTVQADSEEQRKQNRGPRKNFENELEFDIDGHPEDNCIYLYNEV